MVRPAPFFLNDMKVKRISKPLGLAYPLDRVKAFLQVDSDYEDGTISELINAAVGVIYQETWIDLQSTSYVGYLDNFCKTVIYRNPVTEITSVKYYDVNGDLQTMTSGVDYEVDLSGLFGVVRFINEPTLRDLYYNNIEITFKSGYLTQFEIDDELVIALKMMVRDWYDNRESISIKGTVQMIPFAAKVILENASVRTV